MTAGFSRGARLLRWVRWFLTFVLVWCSALLLWSSYWLVEALAVGSWWAAYQAVLVMAAGGFVWAALRLRRWFDQRVAAAR